MRVASAGTLAYLVAKGDSGQKSGVLMTFAAFGRTELMAERPNSAAERLDLAPKCVIRPEIPT